MEKKSDKKSIYQGRLYHGDAFDPVFPVASHWRNNHDLSTPDEDQKFDGRLEEDADCDVAVIGAGFTGLSTAIRLSKQYGMNVQVYDAGYPGFGASGRNGGFCCLGGTKMEFDQMVKKYGFEEAVGFTRYMLGAIDHVEDFIRQNGVDVDQSGEGEIYLAHKPSAIKTLESIRNKIKISTDRDVRLLTAEELKDRGFGGSCFHGGLHLPFGFGVNPLKLTRALAFEAMKHGVKIHPDTPIEHWETMGEGHLLMARGHRIRARKVVVATNGYTLERLHPWFEGKTLPVLSCILTTRPLTESEIKEQGWTSNAMAADTRTLLSYFRLLPDGRFLFGGRGGTDASLQGQAQTQVNLQKRFNKMFPAWQHVEIEKRWSGFVCLTRNMCPYVGEMDGVEGAYTSFGYHGGGVAMANWCGHQLAAIVAGESNAQESLPLPIKQKATSFPLAFLRLQYVRIMYGVYFAKDELL